MKLLKFLMGLSLGLLFILIPFNQFQASPTESLKTITVQMDGRKQPLDTVARETITQIHGKESYTTTDGESLNALETYFSLWLNNRDWNNEPFIIVNYRPLKEQVGLNPEQKYFTFPKLVTSNLREVVLQAEEKDARGEDLTRNEREALTISDRLALMLETVGNQELALVPHPSNPKGTWVSINQAQQYYDSEQVTPIQQQWEQLQQTYYQHPQQLSYLDNVASQLQESLRQLSPQVSPEFDTMKREVEFYAFGAFGKAWQLYAIAFGVMLLVALIPDFQWYWGAIGLFAAGFSVQGYGFIERMQIAGRPPVTNMYESVIWVALGIAGFALLFELIYRACYYLLAAAPLSILCLVLADNLPAVLDPTISPLVPVLRDNFWLSVHVPTITLGYASFALAFGLGHIILAQYWWFPQAQDRIRRLSQFNYRVLQVGILLLTTGVILGGIWAHYAWGRFWGWDPKETWALIALLSYLAPLHGRLAGWLKDFGMAVVSIVCFNSVLMAWYGVNFVLGTGLHSYGFGTGGSEFIVGSVVLFDLLLVLGTYLWIRSHENVSSQESSSVETMNEQFRPVE